MTGSPDPAPPPDPRTPRRTSARDAGIVLLIASGLLTAPVILVAILDMLRMLRLVPAEALLLPGLLAWPFAALWWLIGIVIAAGIALVLTGRRLRPSVSPAIAVAAMWAIGVAYLVVSGALPLPGA